MTHLPDSRLQPPVGSASTIVTMITTVPLPVPILIWEAVAATNNCLAEPCLKSVQGDGDRLGAETHHRTLGAGLSSDVSDSLSHALRAKFESKVPDF